MKIHLISLLFFFQIIGVSLVIAQPKLTEEQMKIRNVALVQTVYINETLAELTEMLQVSSPQQLKTRIPFILAQIDSLQILQEKVTILFEMHPQIQPKPDGDTLLYYSMVRTNALSNDFFSIAQQLQKKYKDSAEINKQFSMMFERFANPNSARSTLAKSLKNSATSTDTLTDGQKKLREFNLENTKLLLKYVERLEKAKSASVATKVLKEYKQFLQINSQKVEELFTKYQFKSSVSPKEASLTGLTDFTGALMKFEQALRASKERFGTDVLFNKAYSTIRKK